MLPGLALGTGAPLLLKGRQRTTTLMFPPPDAMVCWGSPSARRGGAWVRVCSCVQSGGAMRGYGGFIEGGGGERTRRVNGGLGWAVWGVGMLTSYYTGPGSLPPLQGSSIHACVLVPAADAWPCSRPKIISTL